MNCEQLGVRINPANQTFYWIGTEFTEASSWFQTVGTTNTEIPGHMDHIVLGVTPSGSGPMIDGEPTSLVPSNANCTVPVAIAFGSIRVKIDYSATLSVKDDTSAGYLELRNGVLDQVGENNDFTVTTAMDFTGGAINSTGPRGILHLAGGTYFAKIVADGASSERHRWISSGTFTTTAAATITPIVSSGTLGAPVLPARIWNVITATTGVTAAAVLPTVGGGFAGVLRPARDEYDLNW